MSEDYFRFEPSRTVGVISSATSNCVYDCKGKFAIVGALEVVNVWNIRTGQVEQRWYDPYNTSEACVISASPDKQTFAVGYADGTVRLWNLKDGSMGLVFSGHKNQITCLNFDNSGTQLASGARDCDIVIWDLVSECGLFRLRGHTNSISNIVFSNNGKGLISTAKDTLLKIWDLPTQHCVETVVVHHTEITGLITASNRSQVITIGTDNKMRLFSFDEEMIQKKMSKENTEDIQVISLVETINRSSSERGLCLVINENSRYVCVLGSDKSLEIWKLRDEEEFQKQSRKKNPSWFKQVRYTRLQSKARSVEFTPAWKIKSTSSVKLLANFVDNQMGEIIVPMEATAELTFPSAIDTVGHRSDCKVVVFNADGMLFATASKEQVKIWNAETGAMIRTIEVGEATVLEFIGDAALIIATSEGIIHLADLASGELIDSIKTHDGVIRTIAMRPDRKGMMTGGADKNIKFWEFKSSTNVIGKKLKMIKTLQMNDEILVLKYSPDTRYIAAATMDLTVKVFFEDSLRFYLSLYGHKLPVTGIDMSSDSKTLVTCSSDKNIKIWSLEFGDCRKSIFGHQDAITGISFVPNTKQFWTASKDKTMKYWDVEKFTELQKLSGHQAEVWAMALSPNGQKIVSVSKDKSIRVWACSEEMLFPEEEKERDTEEEMEKSLIEENPHEKADDGEEFGRASKKTIATMKAGERIMECIEAADEERRNWEEYYMAKEKGLPTEEPTKGAFYLALGRDKTPAEFVLSAFEKIPLPDIEEALLCLPMNVLPSLLYYISEWLQGRKNIVMSSRILDLVLCLFHQAIIANPSLRMLLESIRELEMSTLSELKDIIGFNTVAIKMQIAQ